MKVVNVFALYRGTKGSTQTSELFLGRGYMRMLNVAIYDEWRMYWI